MRYALTAATVLFSTLITVSTLNAFEGGPPQPSTPAWPTPFVDKFVAADAELGDFRGVYSFTAFSRDAADPFKNTKGFMIVQRKGPDVLVEWRTGEAIETSQADQAHVIEDGVVVARLQGAFLTMNPKTRHHQLLPPLELDLGYYYGKRLDDSAQSARELGGMQYSTNTFAERPGYEEFLNSATFSAGSAIGTRGSIREFDPVTGRISRHDRGFFLSQEGHASRFVAGTSCKVLERGDQFATSIVYESYDQNSQAQVVASGASFEAMGAALDAISASPLHRVTLTLDSMGELPADAMVSLSELWPDIHSYRESETTAYVPVFEGEGPGRKRLLAYDTNTGSWGAVPQVQE